MSFGVNLAILLVLNWTDDKDVFMAILSCNIAEVITEKRKCSQLKHNPEAYVRKKKFCLETISDFVDTILINNLRRFAKMNKILVSFLAVNFSFVYISCFFQLRVKRRDKPSLVVNPGLVP